MRLAHGPERRHTTGHGFVSLLRVAMDMRIHASLCMLLLQPLGPLQQVVLHPSDHGAVSFIRLSAGMSLDLPVVACPLDMLFRFVVAELRFKCGQALLVDSSPHFTPVLEHRLTPRHLLGAGFTKE